MASIAANVTNAVSVKWHSIVQALRIVRSTRTLAPLPVCTACHRRLLLVGDWLMRSST